MLNGIAERLDAFHALQKSIEDLTEHELQTLASKAASENPWFTFESVKLALRGVVKFLAPAGLQSWIANYDLSVTPKRIGLVMAGNIPLVGFHDLLCVLVSGHTAVVKLSSKDRALFEFIINALRSSPAFAEKIVAVERLVDFDAVIATGSNNTSRYFHFYFSKYPHLLRKNRNGVAVLDGTETKEDLGRLGSDVFSYYGLGCRNVSKMLVPASYDFSELFNEWNSYEHVIGRHKYCNNYDYNKAIFLVNQTPFLDNGFVLLQEKAAQISSPISVVYFEHYRSQDELNHLLEAARDEIQCIVGHAFIPFGDAQMPSLTDYADGVDTMQFLTSL